MGSKTVARESILEAAIRCLCRVPAGSLTVDAIAREADCAKGLVHYHFKTKSALFAAAAERLWANRTARWTEALSHGDPKEAIERSWTLLTEEAEQGTGWFGDGIEDGADAEVAGDAEEGGIGPSAGNGEDAVDPRLDAVPVVLDAGGEHVPRVRVEELEVDDNNLAGGDGDLDRVVVGGRIEVAEFVHGDHVDESRRGQLRQQMAQLASPVGAGVLAQCNEIDLLES